MDIDIPQQAFSKLSDVLANTDKVMLELNLPVMRKPEGLGQEYSFPTDVKHLDLAKLGSLQLMLTAYMTYSMGVLGEEEATLGAMESVYDTKLGLAMASEKKNLPGQTNREMLSGLALAHDPSLTQLNRFIIARKHLVSKLTAQIKIFDTQLSRLSREQSRREAEMAMHR